MAQGRFLLVEDEIRLGEALCRLFDRYRSTVLVRTVSEANVRLSTETERWTGLVVDIGLPDGSGLEVVDHARGLYPLLPMLVLTGRFDRVSINRSHALRAEFVCKPATEDDLAGFLRRAITFERVGNDRIAALVDELCRACALTPREVDLVGAVLAGNARKAILDQFDITENTLKSQVRTLLRKTGHESLDALMRALYRDALAGSETPAPVADLADLTDADD